MKKSLPNILVVEDNKDVIVAIRLLLRTSCNSVDSITNPNQIYSTLEKQTYDAIILDMNFVAGLNTGNEGFFWMNEILKIDSDLSVVFLTAYAELEKAVLAIQEGAIDYIEKPWEDDKLVTSVLRAAEITKSKREIKSLKKINKNLRSEIETDQNIYQSTSPAMLEIFSMVEKVAKTDANILILGENGIGKEVLARQIHKHSNRNDSLFVSIDLGTISESLFESELFGHEKGAFTDAKESKQGKLEPASGGTLFLDEIGNLNLETQKKLLTTIQNKKITPVGSSKQIDIDVRLITATNTNLYDAVENKQFREDLLYRINTVTIEIPPLRTRPDDIKGLSEYFLKIYANKYQKSVSGISEKGIEYLQKYNWPGNIRELEHAIEKAVILSETEILRDIDFSFRKPLSTKNFETLDLENNEKALIKTALEKHKNNYTETANELGITRRTLYNKIKKYGF
ncbi:MAG: sigma-54-dependent Fis family transcriptional regulator [Bacteroidales bacterium]|nr:sigma-54-dependent Fis family transcriptional regulator [Bacteroidales bacterium]